LMRGSLASTYYCALKKNTLWQHFIAVRRLVSLLPHAYPFPYTVQRCCVTYRTACCVARGWREIRPVAIQNLQTGLVYLALFAARRRLLQFYSTSPGRRRSGRERMIVKQGGRLSEHSGGRDFAWRRRLGGLYVSLPVLLPVLSDDTPHFIRCPAFAAAPAPTAPYAHTAAYARCALRRPACGTMHAQICYLDTGHPGWYARRLN